MSETMPTIAGPGEPVDQNGRPAEPVGATAHIGWAEPPAPHTAPAPARKRGFPLWVWIAIAVLAQLIVAVAISFAVSAAGAALFLASAPQPAAVITFDREAGAGQVSMPDIVGLTVAEARAQLEEAGLEINALDAPETAVIATQLYAAGLPVDAGTVILVTVEKTEVGALGSSTNPYPAGTPIAISESDTGNPIADVSVALKDADAGAAIGQAEASNPPAAAGYHYVAVEFAVIGQYAAEPVNVAMLLADWSLAQENGTAIPASASALVLPDGWTPSFDVPDLAQGQTGSAVVVYEVPDAYTGPLLATAYGNYLAL